MKECTCLALCNAAANADDWLKFCVCGGPTEE